MWSNLYQVYLQYEQEATFSWNFGRTRHCAHIRNASVFILLKILSVMDW